MMSKLHIDLPMQPRCHLRDRSLPSNFNAFSWSDAPLLPPSRASLTQPPPPPRASLPSRQRLESSLATSTPIRQSLLPGHRGNSAGATSTPSHHPCAALATPTPLLNRIDLPSGLPRCRAASTNSGPHPSPSDWPHLRRGAVAARTTKALESKPAVAEDRGGDGGAGFARELASNGGGPRCGCDK